MNKSELYAMVKNNFELIKAPNTKVELSETRMDAIQAQYTTKIEAIWSALTLLVDEVEIDLSEIREAMMELRSR